MTVVLTPKSWSNCLLQSELDWKWAIEYGNKLENRPQYTPTDCFETFPFPSVTTGLADMGKTYYGHRRQIMLSRQEGLTKTYNRFHDPDESAADIQKLRDLHVEMDKAVAAAYGWADLDLGHGFHETKQGTRFTISESARREVLARLLKLNHERYAEEVAQGLHDKKGKAKPPRPVGAARPSRPSGVPASSMTAKTTPTPIHPTLPPRRKPRGRPIQRGCLVLCLRQRPLGRSEGGSHWHDPPGRPVPARRVSFRVQQACVGGERTLRQRGA